MKTKTNIGLMILAAGASTRLGAPKQLLSFNGQTLLRRVALAALESVCQPVVVVLGSRAETCEKHLAPFELDIVVNKDWEKGMGTSIRAGIEKLLKTDERADGAVITLCDQPFVSCEIINRLAETFYQTGAPVVASAYAGTRGTPALFSRTLFPDLMNLKGGAKELIGRYSSETVSIEFPEGEIDIDTMEDVRRLKLKIT